MEKCNDCGDPCRLQDETCSGKVIAVAERLFTWDEWSHYCETHLPEKFKT